MKITFLHIFIFFASLNLFAQQKYPVVSWDKILPTVENVHRVIQNRAGNIIILGEQEMDGYIAEMRTDGSFFFEKTLNPNRKNGYFDPMNIVEAKDGNGYYIAARQGKSNQIALVRVDLQGNIVWHYALDETESTNVDIVEDTEGHRIYVALKSKSGFGIMGVQIPQTPSAKLPIIWKKTFEPNGTATRLILTKDRKLLVAGFESVDPYSTGLLKCLNTEGSVLWERRFEKSVFYDLMVSEDNQIWVCGYFLTKRDNRDMLLMSVSPSGDVVLTNEKFGGIGLDVARSFVRTEDGEFYLIGSSTSKTRSDRFDDMCLIKTTAKGKEAWFTPFYLGKSELDVAHTGVLLPDGRLVIAGESNEKGQIIMLDKAFSPKNKVTEKPIALQQKTSQATTAEMPPSVKAPILTIQWLSPNPLKTGFRFDAAVEQLHIEVQARSSQPLAKEHFKLLINNRPYFDGAKFDNVKIRKSPNDKAGDYTFFWEADVALPIGKSTIEVVVTNAAGTAKTEILEPNFISKPNLYLLSVGIPSDLMFTTRDAADIVQAFKAQEGRLFQRVFADVLNTESATTGSMLIQNIGYLRDGYQIRPHDVVIIFMSSHGFADQTDANNFYIQPSDVKRQYAPACLDFKKHVRDVLQQIKAKQLILIDACQSGAGIKGDDTEKINHAIAQLMKTETGLRCISSSRANEKSHEDPLWQNGAFTKAIKEAFGNENVMTTEGYRRANSNDDGWLTLKELYAFLKIRVPFMVNSVKGAAQNPQSFNIETSDDFPIFVY